MDILKKLGTMLSLNSQISDKLKVGKNMAVCNNGDSRVVKK